MPFREFLLKKVGIFFELIKFEHTVFALPFAYLGMILAEQKFPSFWVFLWVTTAMAGARTAAMTLNRIIDVRMDARNPRTRLRPSVTGEFSLRGAWVAAAISLIVFFGSAAFLNPLCLKLSPLAAALLIGYHYVKRFSFLSHFILGLALSIAPMGGWLAVTGVFSWQPVLLALSVLFWVAGFDILYSLQDVEFDRSHALHSVPVRFGEKRALEISFYCHAATVVLLAAFGAAKGLGILYYTGVFVTAVLLWIEHRLVDDGGLERIDAAFFTVNGWIGILLFVFSFLEIYR